MTRTSSNDTWYYGSVGKLASLTKIRSGFQSYLYGKSTREN